MSLNSLGLYAVWSFVGLGCSPFSLTLTHPAHGWQSGALSQTNGPCSLPGMLGHGRSPGVGGRGRKWLPYPRWEPRERFQTQTYVQKGFGSGVATSRLIYTPVAPREADRLMDGDACWPATALMLPQAQLISSEFLSFLATPWTQLISCKMGPCVLNGRSLGWIPSWATNTAEGAQAAPTPHLHPPSAFILPRTGCLGAQGAWQEHASHEELNYLPVGSSVTAPRIEPSMPQSHPAGDSAQEGS